MICPCFNLRVNDLRSYWKDFAHLFWSGRSLVLQRLYSTQKDMVDKTAGYLSPNNTLEDVKVAEGDRSTDVKNVMQVPLQPKCYTTYHITSQIKFDKFSFH